MMYNCVYMYIYIYTHMMCMSVYIYIYIYIYIRIYIYSIYLKICATCCTYISHVHSCSLLTVSHVRMLYRMSYETIHGRVPSRAATSYGFLTLGQREWDAATSGV